MEAGGRRFRGALSHDTIHTLDITTALGIDHTVPQDRLRADDMDWSYGSGTPVQGSGQHLLSVLCGRTLPPGLLHGAAADRFQRHST